MVTLNNIISIEESNKDLFIYSSNVSSIYIVSGIAGYWLRETGIFPVHKEFKNSE